MAIENAKTLNVRIRNKYDSYEKWAASSLVLEAGEIAIAHTTVDVKVDNGTAKHPALLMKVGDGEKTFANLPWLSARAADVLSVCKNEGELKTFINGVIADAGIASSDAMEALAGRVTDTEDAIEVLNGAVDVEGSVAKAIADAIAALNIADTYAAKVHGHEIDDVDGLTDAIADAKKAGTDANAALEAYKTTNDAAVAKALTDANAYTDGKDTAMDTRVKALEDKFGDGEGNVESQIAAAVDAEKERAEGAEAGLQDAIDAINNADTGILKQAKDYTDGKDEAIAAAQKAGDDAMAEAQKKVASVTAGDASVTVAGTSTAPTVAAKLSADADNALTLAADGLKVVIPAAAEYSIVKAADSGEYAAVYNLTKDGAVVGASINIPKDMVVKSGSVVGDEIVLVLNDESATEIKIPVASLIEYVTSGSQTGDMVVVNVSDDHKVTATITDGTITLAKLTTEVQTAIGKAHSHENADVLAGINADKVAAWDAAEQNAKDYADGLDEAMNARVEALEAVDHEHANKALLDTYTQTETDLADAVAKKHEHANKSELDLIASGDKAKWDAKVDDVTAAADSGLKATRTGNAVAIEIDDSITWVFDCGTSAV
jgi:hypothetical protein